MKNLLTKYSNVNSVLGIVLSGDRMTVSHVRRAGSGIKVHQSIQVTLSLDILGSAPELVGQEIRNHLDQAGIRESRCVVCVPLDWILVRQAELPELSAADLDSYLAIQSEREFPYPPEDLSIATSFYQIPNDSKGATVAALPVSQLSTLQSVFRAAHLRLAGVTLGVTSLIDAATCEAGAALLVTKTGIDFAVTAPGGVAVLRSLEGLADSGEDADSLDSDSLLRQIRISLRQLPAPLHDVIDTLAVFGSGDSQRAVLDALQESASAMNLSVVEGEWARANGLELTEPGERAAMPAIAAAATYLRKAPILFQFLPPRSTRFQQAVNRVSARAALWLVAAACVLVFGLGAAFLIQYWRLSSLEREWARIAPTAQEVEALQNKVGIYRPWFDQSIPTLAIARSLTEAFPEDGAAWATSVTISEHDKVSCSGKARTDDDWLRMLEALGTTPGVEDLQVLQRRGNRPLEFSLSYRWNPGGRNGI